MSATPHVPGPDPAAPSTVHDLDQPPPSAGGAGPGIEISKRLVLVNTLSSIARRAIVVGVLVWVQQLFIRRVDVAEYALLSVTNALVVVLPLIPSMFSAGLRRFATDAYARRDEAQVTRIVSTMAPVLWLVAGLTALVGLVLAAGIGLIFEQIPDELVPKAQLMFGLLVLGMALRFAAAPFGLGFDLRQRFVLRNGIGLACEVFKMLLLIALISWRVDVVWVAVSNFATTVVELIVTTAVSMRLVRALRLRLQEFRREIVGQLVHFGGWSLVIQVSLIVRDYADVYVLGTLSSLAELNSFTIGSIPDRQVRQTYVEATSSALPAITAMNSTGQDERLRSAFFRLTRISLWVLLALALPLIVYRDEVVGLYIGEREAVYSTVAVVMALLLSRVIVIFPNTLLGMVAAAKAQVKPVALQAAAMSAANLLLTLYLVGVRGMGAVGSALGTVIVTLIGAPLLNWTLAMRLTGARMTDWLRATFLPGLVPGLLAGPAWYLLWRAAPPDGWLALAAHVAAGGAVYLLGLALALRPQDRADLAAAWTRIRAGKAGAPKT